MREAVLGDRACAGRGCGGLLFVFSHVKGLLMLESIASGGLLMVPIIVASVIALAICIERSWFLRREKVVPQDALLRFQKLLQKNGYTEEELRALASSSLLGWVYFDVLKKVKLGREEMKEAMEVSISQASYVLERYLTTLGVIASVCPLLGLLGTVIGMIDVFDTITETGAKSAVSLAGGISIALVTTASGLVVAIPSLVMHRVFVRRVDEFLSEMTQKTTKFVDLFGGDQ